MMMRFVIYGCLGWCIEVVFTAIANLVTGKAKNLRLEGHTYLWMFPIYAFGGLFLEQVHQAIRPFPVLLRGLIYMMLIFAIEYISGHLLRLTIKHCPWDYRRARWNIQGVIRLDYGGFWFLTGVIFEILHDYLVAYIH